MIAVDLVVGTLLERRDNAVRVDGGEVPDLVEGRRREVGQEEEVLGDEEFDSLAELEGVASCGGVIA